jgi:acetyl esterase/lipase
MRTRRVLALLLTTGVLAAALVGVVAVLAGSASAAKPDADCTETPRVVHDLRYDTVDGVDPNLLSLDLYLPTTGRGCDPVPLVIGVHGGGWAVGDKRGFTGDKAELFNEQGWAFASVNYRLSSPDASPPVAYPTHNQDVASAVAFLVDHGKQYGIDPEQVGILGHSAGAGIVAAIATDEQYLEDAGVGLDTLRCAFPDDTEGFDVAGRIADGGRAARIYENAFGTDPATWADASPINHIESGKDIPPVLLTQRGAPRRVAQMQAFADALRAAGVDVEVIDATGYSHGDVNRLIGSTTDDVMTAPVTQFFEQCFDGRS